MLVSKQTRVPICCRMRFLCPCLFALLLCAGIARADELKEVQRLQTAGQTAEAIERARKAVAASPKDAAMRFQLGLMLADEGSANEARAVFEQLVQDYPDLPEPYNNLAALKAAAGDYEGAKVALDQALRANPSMATAHENLGDVHLMLALRAYERARQLDPTSTTVPGKLALLRQLMQSSVQAATRR